MQWLKLTNFYIVVVDNSGYNYDELFDEKDLYKDRFEVVSFHEDELQESQYLKNNPSKGDSEIFAINYAFHKSRFVCNCEFIIKITARYYVDELEKYLNHYNLSEYSCLTQNNRDRCEMVGSRYNCFFHIFRAMRISLYL